MIWRALELKMAVIDASASVMAVHQRHDYSHVRGGEDAVYKGEGAKRNFELSGGIERLLSISDATHELTAKGRPRRRRRVSLSKLFSPPWYRLLDLTHSARCALNLNRVGINRVKHRLLGWKEPA